MSRFDRRSLMRFAGLGAGAALLAPLVTRLARAGATTPRRFVFVVEGNCFEPVTMLSTAARAAIDATTAAPLGAQRWWPRSYRHERPLEIPSADFTGASALAPIASVPGLAAQTTVLFGLSSRVCGGGHSAMHGALSSSRTISGVPGGPTIDALLASLPQIRGQTPYDVLRLGVSGDPQKPLDFGTCAHGAGRAAPMVLQPTVAFNSVFGSVASPAARAGFARRGGLFGFARDDLNATLATFSGNSRERAKLESYLASLEEMSRRQRRVIALESQLTAVRPVPPETNPLYAGTDPLDRFRAHVELATAALKGELTNVAVIGCGTGGDFIMTYPSVLPGVHRHDLHHGSGRTPAFLAAIHEVTRLQVEAIAGMARALAATPEAGTSGTMLDHTVIVYIGDNGEQHHSTASEFPILLLGGSALGLRPGGRTVVYPGLDSTGHRQVSNLWNTLGHCAGTELNDFGSEGISRVAAGPLTELRA